VVTGATATDILQTEAAVAQMSGSSSPSLILGDFEKDITKPQVQVLTEGAIYESVLKLINSAKPKEHLDLSMFYLSERKIIQAL
ncbi:phospholipase, partial [Acinetobacter baumannii]